MSEVKIPDVDWFVDVSNLPRAGAEFWFEAADDLRLQLAESLDLVSLDRFVVRVKVTSRKKRNFYVAGTLDGAAVQSCVVTLKPVATTISGKFDRLLVAQDSPRDENVEQLVPREVVFDPADDDPPDLFDGNMIDIGMMGLEEFVLLLDPYPRHPSADDWQSKDYASPEAQSDMDIKPDNPFAALSKLKSE
jgi:Uncharacterized ACR, COG1399.